MNVFRTRRRSRAGFALYEIIFCIGLATVALSISARTIQLVLRVYRETPAAAQAVRDEEQWLGRLRQDAWSATAVRVDGSTLTLSTGSKTVVWQTADGTLRRTSGPDVAHWSFAKPLAWRAADGVLTCADGTSTIPLATPTAQKAGEP